MNGQPKLVRAPIVALLFGAAGCVTASPAPCVERAVTAVIAPPEPVKAPVEPLAVVQPEPGPQETLARFLDAASQRHFEEAYALLSSPLRARYTPARLSEDFSLVQEQAGELLSRARVALSAAPRLEGRAALFPIAEGRAIRLVREESGWKVESLE